MSIDIYSPYGDPRRQAARPRSAERPLASGGEDAPHGLTAQQVEQLRARMDSMMPRVASQHGNVQDVMSGILPDGAELSPGAGAGYREAMQRAANVSGGSFANGPNGTLQSPQRPYQPEFESPDRQQYPVHRILANRCWRLFYKLDHVIGTGVDMYADLPWGDVQFTGDGVDGEVKDIMEFSWQECQMRERLPMATREFFVVGEAAPHLFWDDTKGCWTYCALHNPDQLEVIDAPFIKMDPVVEFVPDGRLQQVLTSNNAALRRVRESMPPELLTRLMARQNIPLSPVNFTFIPRKLHPYDTRGTSIISRMWRILMYEDAIYNASIATARRHAGPLKIAKLGNPSNGWIPGPEHERKLVEMLAQAELDVNAWLVYHYAISFELVGTTERVMTIDKHNETIERVKLIALGISKAFLHGEVTYASAASGLTVFLQRLKALRQLFEAKWLIPKFFLQMAKINKWVRPTEAELSHNVRVRRSNQEVLEDTRFIVPTMQWAKALDPNVDSEMIRAAESLNNLGVQLSKSTLTALANKDFEAEAIQRVRDHEIEQRVYADHPELMGGDAGGAGGGGLMPGMDPGMFGDLAPSDDMGGDLPPLDDMPAPDVPGLEAAGADGESATQKQNLFDDSDRAGKWSSSQIKDAQALMRGDTSTLTEQLWIDAADDSEVQAALRTQDEAEIWDALQHFLAYEDFPSDQVKQLDDILNGRGREASSSSVKQRAKEAQLLDMIDGYGGSDFLSGSD